MMENRLKAWTVCLGGLVIFSLAYISWRRVNKPRTQRKAANKSQTGRRSENNLPDRPDRQDEKVDSSSCNEGVNNVPTPDVDELLGELKCEIVSEGSALTQAEENLNAEEKTEASTSVQHQISESTAEVSERSETGEENRSSVPEAKLKTHSQKSKIPHFSHHEKTKFGFDRNKTNLLPAKHAAGKIESTHESSSKLLRPGMSLSVKKSQSDEYLKQKYKSLFRADQQNDHNDQLCGGDISQYEQDEREMGAKWNETDSPGMDSLITDEDGSNLLMESGFFDNDLSITPESPELPEVDLFTACSPSGSSEKFCATSEESKLYETLNQESKESESVLFKEAEEELLMNIAIQNADVQTLLEIVSKSEGVEILTRGFQALAEFSKDASNHEIHLNYLDFIYSCLDLGDDAMKFEVLKVLLNLSRNAHLLPSLLSAKAPASLLKYFLLDVCEDVQLTWLAFVLNVFEYGKKNRPLHQLTDSSKKAGIDSISGVLFGIRSSRIIKNRVYLLTRHRNRHVSHVARQIYSDMSRRDGV